MLYLKVLVLAIQALASGDFFVEIFKSFFKDSSGKCLVIDGQFILPDTSLKTGFIMYTSDMNNVDKTAFCSSFIISSRNPRKTCDFIRNTVNNTGSKVLLINEKAFGEEIKELFNLSWERNLNIFIVETAAQSKNITIHSVMQKKQLGLCSVDEMACISNISFSYNAWSPELMLKNLNRTFKVSASAHPPYFERHQQSFRGIDFELVKLMIPKWPITFRMFPEDHEPEKGVHYESLVDFLRSTNDGDMSIGGLWLTDDFPSSPPYAKQCNTFLVHRPSLLPDSTFVFQYFRVPLWLSYFTVLLVMSLLLKVSYSLYNVVYSFDYCLLIILHYVANLGIPKFPSQRQFYARYVLSVWIVFCLLVTTYFCVGLTVTLRFPRFTQTINSWYDMVDLRIKWVENSVFYRDRLMEWGKHEEYFTELANLFEYEENIDVMNEKLRENYAVRVQKLPGFYLTHTRWMDQYAKKNFKLLKDCFLVWYNAFLFKNPSPFLEHFNRKTLEMVEYGFVNYWYQHHTNRKKNRYMMVFFNEYSDEFIQFIKLDKLKSCFFLLFCGWILGLVVFLFERLQSQ